MNKIIKNPIFTFILGAIIFGSIGVLANNYLATNISFTPKNTNWKKEDGTDITNVKDALDELYGLKNKIPSNILNYSSNDSTNFVSTYEANSDKIVVATCLSTHSTVESGYYSNTKIESNGTVIDEIDSETYKGGSGTSGWVNYLQKIYKLEKGQKITCTSNAYGYGYINHTFIEY